MRHVSAAGSRPRGRLLLAVLALVAACVPTVVLPVAVAPVSAEAGLSVVITYSVAAIDTQVDAGDIVHFTYAVTNGTEASATGVDVTDSLTSTWTACVENGAETIAAGATLTCTADYTVTQSDIDTGLVSVTVDVTADGDLTATSSTTIPITIVPKIDLVASSSLVDSNSSGRHDAGDTLTFTFVGTNSGNVGLTAVAITGSLTEWGTDAGGSCATLAPDATCTLTRTKVLDQDDIDAGTISDSGDVAASWASGTVSDSTDPEVFTISRVSTATISKTAGTVDDSNANSRVDAGETAHFAIVVTNTGTTTLNTIDISDVAVGASKDCAPLAPAATCTLDVTHVLTQTEVDAGTFSNTATVTATGHTGVFSHDSTASVTIVAEPSLTITTTAPAFTDGDSDSLPDAGEAVPITVAVFNDGNVTLTGLTVSSDHSVATQVCATLAPLATCTLSTSYTLTQSDIDSGALAVNGSVTEVGEAGALDATDAAPSLTLARSAVASIVTTSTAPIDGDIAVGSSYTFTVTVTNAGNTTLTSVTVSDSLGGSGEAGTTPCATLLPGASCTLTQPHTVTQANVDAGEVVDTGSVTAMPPEGVTLSTAGTPTLTVSIDRTATLGVVTSSSFTDTNSNGRTDAGESVTFTVTATNTGNTTLSAATVSDSLTGGVTGGTTPCATVAPGGTCTFTRTYTITQAAINAGSIADTGSSTATAVSGLSDPTASDLETFSITRTASLGVVTSGAAYVDSNSNSRPDVGESVTFTVTATNTGNTTLSAVTVSDSLTGGATGGTSPCASVAPGGTCTFTRAHPLTQAEIDAGAVTDTGSATATPPSTVVLSTTPNAATVNLSRSSDMTITKSTTGIVITDVSGYPVAGNRVPYTVTATNIGNTTVTSVTVADELTAASTTCPSVAPGGTCVLTTDYFLTQTDINAGTRSNKGTVSATAPDASISKNITINTPISRNSQLSLTNVAGPIVDANTNGKQDKNDTVTFTLTATNSGNTTLSAVSISSPLTSATHPCGTMAPGAICSFTSTYTLLQADLNNGSITNAATVAGTAPSGSAGAVTASASASVTITATFTLSLTKTTPGYVDTNVNGRADAGETITYTVTATNTGTTKFATVTLSDTQTVTTSSCSNVEPGQTCVWSFSHTLTQSDINSGSVTGTATADGSGRGGGTATATAENTVTIDRTASLSLNTTSGGITEVVGAGRHDAGDRVSFTVTVTNTGNTTLTAMTVTDSIGSGSTVCASLAPGGTCVLTTTHTLTQADVDAGSVSDTGAVVATPQSGLTLSKSGTATATQLITRSAVASVVTTAATFVDSDGDGYADAGETIAFTVTVTNSGNTTLTAMSVSDTLTDGTPGGTSPCASVAPGGTCTRTRTHTLTQAEVDAGSVANTGSVTATPPAGVSLSTDGTPTRTVTIIRSSTASLANTAGSLTDAALPVGASPGDTIGYTIVATNTGTTTLTAVTVSDGVTVGSQICATVAPGATCTLSTTYTLLQSDVDAGKVDNTASLAFTGHSGAGSATKKATTNVPQTNTLSFSNTAGSVIDENTTGRTDVGDSITYTIAMQNTGNTTLTSVSMYSPKTTYTKSCGTVAPGAVCTATTKYTLVQDDLDLGSVSNAGTVSATSPGGALSGSDTATTTLPRTSSVSLVKSAGSIVDSNSNAKDDVGDSITYTVTATNTGTTTLTSISISDALTADSKGCASVAPSATCTLTTTYALLQSDLDLGGVANTATVTATGHEGQISSTADRSVTITRVGGVSLTMVAGAVTDTNGTPVADVGDTVAFTLTARNTGNTTLRSIVVTDTLTSGVKRCSTLAPNATCVLTATHTLEIADIDAGSVANTGDVATSAFDGARSASANATATLPQASSIAVTAVAAAPSDDNSSGRVDVGDSVTFTVAATNNGNSTLTSVTVRSDLTAASTSCTRLLPGEECTLTTSRTLTQAEVDAGTFTHGSSASATAPDGSVSDSDSLPVTVARTSSVGVVTTATSINDWNSSGRHDAGDRVTFTVTATNTGSTTLTSMTVSDTLSGGSPGGTAPCASVAPGGTCTRIRTHTLTQLEVDAGSVANTGSVSATGHSGAVSGSGERSVAINRISSVSVATTATSVTDGDANGVDAGDTLTFTVTVTNSGNRTLTAMTLSDTLTDGTPGGTSPCASVAPGATCTRTRTHTLTQAEINDGSVSDTGSASATGHSGTVTGSNTRTVDLARTSRLAVVAVGASVVDANSSGRSDAGDTVAFTITATNTGNTTLTSATVSLPLTGGSTSCGTLTPGAECVLHSTRTLSQSEINSGSSSGAGSASATGHSGGAGAVTASGSTTVSITRISSISVDQSAGSVSDRNSSGRTDVGDTVLYTITATNTGSTTLSGVLIIDELTGATESCASIAPSATCVLVTGHTLAQSDLDLGQIANSAAAGATGHLGSISTTDSVSIPISQVSSLAIVNHAGAVVDANRSLRVDAGDTVTFGILATNTGTTTLTDVVIEDPLTGGLKNCAPLVPGAKCTLLTTYTLQLADVNEGQIVNLAAVSARGHAGSVSAQATATVVLVRTADIRALSTFIELLDTDSDGVADAAERARFVLRATNYGNTSLRDVTVTDPDHGATVTCPLVAPGGYCEVTSDVLMSQFDIDTNQVGSSAVVTGQPANGAQVGDEYATVVTILTSELLGISAVETGRTDSNADGVLEAGDTLTVTVVATNVGSRTLHNVVVSDGHVQHTAPCSVLAPGAPCTLEVVHTIDADDVALGYFETPGSVVGLGPTNESVDASTTVLTVLDPATPLLHVAIEMSEHTDVDGSASINSGDVLGYTISARNLATTVAHAVVLVSSLTGAEHTCPTLAPAATCSFTTTHTVTRAEAGSGSLRSAATGTSTEVATQTVAVSTEVVGGEHISIVASLDTLDLTIAGPVGRVDAGDVGHWTYSITNDGDAVLSGLELSGDLAADVVCPPGSLASIAVDATIECSLDRALTQADIDAEQIDVSLTVESSSGTSGTDALVTPLVADATVDLVKSVRGHAAACDDDAALPAVGIGGVARWCFAITNSGNRTLSTLQIEDSLLAITDGGSQPSGLPLTLAPGATAVVSVTQSHEVSLTNSATVSATVVGTRGLGGTTVTSDASTATLTVAPVQPVSGVVWFDLDLDGSHDDGEPLLPDVTVTLTAAGDDSLVGVAATDSEGTYSFDEVLPGTYALTVERGVYGIGPHSDTDGGTDWIVEFSLLAEPVEADFGGTGMATLDGKVLDATLDQPMAGVDVRCSWVALDGLFGTDDDVAFTAATGGDGRYALSRLPYGDMRCVFTAREFTDTEGFIVRLDAPTSPFGDMMFGRQTPLVGSDSRQLLSLAWGLTLLGGALALAARRRPRRAPC